jgi:hypothetical protein
MTDLFVHQTTHMIAAMGVRYPARVVAGGGIYLEYDEREVPDVATVVADYDEGCQLVVSSTMISGYPLEEVIRGRLATIKFVRDGFEFIADVPKNGSGVARRLEDGLHGEYVDGHGPKGSGDADTKALWVDFLARVRSRDPETLCTPELGAAALTTMLMGVQSYRQGAALFWDKEARKPVRADASWAARWEQRSKRRGKPSQILGWNGGDAGSTLEPPAYMSLAGPWVDGKDPAGGS